MIVGAGPAGLQMAYFLKQADVDYLVLEKNDTAGAFYKKFPVHRRLISINKKYNYFTEKTFNLRHDWNSLLSDKENLSFTNYSDELFPHADDLYNYLQDFARETELNIQYNTSINFIRKSENGDFILELANGKTQHCSVLLLGTGVVSQYMPASVKGIEHTIPYREIPTDKEQFKNKRVAVLGGGNSAFETANHIADVAAHVHVLLRSPIKMAYETHFVGDLRAKYTNIFDMYQLKSLHAVLKPNLKELIRLEDGTIRTRHEYDYPESDVRGTLKLSREYDYVLNCTGFMYTHDDLFETAIMPNTVMKDKFYALNSCWESSNVSNLFIIGTGMQAIDRKASSGFIHGFRYNIRTLSKLLLEKYENRGYPSEHISLNPFEAFLKALYTRFSIADSIFQLYGFLGDMLVYDKEKEALDWYKDLPIQNIAERKPRNKKVLQLTLEFGFQHYPDKSSLEFLGPSDPHNTDKSAFLHPVIRYYYQDEYKEFHFGDSLLGRWDMPHNEGGAIASYHSEFYNWLAEIFDLEKIDPSELGENPNFVKWD